MTKKKKIGIILAAAAGAGVLLFGAMYLRKPRGNPHYFTEDFGERTDVFLVVEIGTETFSGIELLNLSRNISSGVQCYSVDSRLLETLPMQAGAFLELTYAGYSYIGCGGAGTMVTKITDCRPLTQEEGLAARAYTYEGLPEEDGSYPYAYVPSYLIRQDEEADCIMVPQKEQFLVYQPGAEPMLFENRYEVMDYFHIPVQSPEQTETSQLD